MRRVLLLFAAAVLILVPGCASVFAALSPRPRRILPVGFWALWLMVSLWTMFYAPALVDRLTSRNAGNHKRATYARWDIVLGIINIAWSVASPSAISRTMKITRRRDWETVRTRARP